MGSNCLKTPLDLSGRVYGTLLNHRSGFTAVESAMGRPPYLGAPRAPVLYLKPKNTLAANGADVRVPSDVEELEAGGCLGIVIGAPACNVRPDRAMSAIGGYVIVNDVSVPHTEYYRPSIRQKARDGFCPIGPRVAPVSTLTSLDEVIVRVSVDGALRSVASTADLIRPVFQLISDVTEFMTLSPGDVLAVGVAFPAPRVRVGQTVRVEIDGIGALENRFIAEDRSCP